MHPNPSSAFSALGSPMTMGKVSLFLSSPGNSLTPNQKENPKDLKPQFSIVQNQCSPLGALGVTECWSTRLFLPGGHSTKDFCRSGPSYIRLVQHRRNRAQGAIRHHLHETLRRAMHRFHKCIFVFIKPCCLLHKFQYSPCIFLVLLPVT